MERKKVLLFVLLAVFLLLNFTLVFINLFIFSSDLTITGKSSFLSGGVFFSIHEIHSLFIYHPENEIYDFEKSAESYYLPIYDIELNVSSTFDAFNWRYFLMQTTPRNTKNDMTGFFNPNSIIKVYRWENNLTVYADDSSGSVYSENVVFYVDVPNSAPLIQPFDSELYVCENQVLVYYFNATDRDEDGLKPGISPSGPFYIGNPTVINQTTTRMRITSMYVRKSHIGKSNEGNKTYPHTVYVSDEKGGLDSKEINITAIEINNYPAINNIGVQTVWTHGDDSVFYKQVKVSDTEDGDSDSGNLEFSIEFFNSEKLFDINRTGWMRFEPNESHLEEDNSSKNYYLEICVEDRGIQKPHPLIEEKCGQTGESITTCQNFTLTVTEDNRPPLITSYYPLDTDFEILGTDDLYFNVSVYDSDKTIPDIYWYLDDEMKQYTSGELNDEFNYNFGCDVSGNYKIKVEATDGLLNASINWSVLVKEVPCPGPPPREIRAEVCVPEWVSGDWGICQNLGRTLIAGAVTGENYRNVKRACEQRGLTDLTCGFQIRDSIDLNKCGLFYNLPSQIQECYFVEEPSCFDGIQNCHSGLCEIGIDCGGPCRPCPTCSDKIQNQGEEGIDCGGPCPWPCPKKTLLDKDMMMLYLILGILFLSSIILILKIKRILKYRKILSNKKK